MSDQDDDERKPLTEREDPGPTSEGIKTEPRGNPDVDADAVEKGMENLNRVKPY